MKKKILKKKTIKESLQPKKKKKKPLRNSFPFPYIKTKKSLQPKSLT